MSETPMTAEQALSALAWAAARFEALASELVELEARRVAADEALAGSLQALRSEAAGMRSAAMQAAASDLPEWRIDGGRYLVMDGGAWRSATAAESVAIQASHAPPRSRR
jgi:hypothetical protein